MVVSGWLHTRHRDHIPALYPTICTTLSVALLSGIWRQYTMPTTRLLTGAIYPIQKQLSERIPFRMTASYGLLHILYTRDRE